MAQRTYNLQAEMHVQDRDLADWLEGILEAVLQTREGWRLVVVPAEDLFQADGWVIAHDVPESFTDSTTELLEATDDREMRVFLDDTKGDARVEQAAVRVGAFCQSVEGSAGGLGDAEVAVLVEDFLRRLESVADRDFERMWLQATEVLIHRLDELLNDRERLEQELAVVLDDLDVAHTRIDELEKLNELIKAEAYQTKNHTNKNLIGAIAVAIITSLGLIGQAYLSQPRAEAVDKASQAADKVIVHCGDATATANIPPPTTMKAGADKSQIIVPPTLPGTS